MWRDYARTSSTNGTRKTLRLSLAPHDRQRYEKGRRSRIDNKNSDEPWILLHGERLQVALKIKHMLGPLSLPARFILRAFLTYHTTNWHLDPLKWLRNNRANEKRTFLIMEKKRGGMGGFEIYSPVLNLVTRLYLVSGHALIWGVMAAAPHANGCQSAAYASSILGSENVTRRIAGPRRRGTV